MDVLKDLELLIDSHYPIIAIESSEEDRAERVLERVAGRLGIPFFTWSLSQGLQRSGTDGPLYDSRKPDVALSTVASMASDGMYLFKDLHKKLDDPEVVRKLLDLARPFGRSRRALFLCAPRVELPADLEKLAARFRLDLPDEEELTRLARAVVPKLVRGHGIKLAISRGEFIRLVEALKGLTLFEAERALTRAILHDDVLNRDDLKEIIAIKRELLQKDGLLDFLPPGDGMSEIGGLENLKVWLRKRKDAFTREARQFGVPPPRGIVLIGVQGCGKSMAAKAVASEWGLPLLKLEAGRLYDKYVGESEKNLERALRVAEGMSPCVLMIDEIEKGFDSSGSSDADAGLSRRILGRLLGWLQDHSAPVFLVATCNQMDRLPPELVRKGRFDEIFFLDLPGRSERREIFSLHLKKRKRDPAAFDLDALSDAAEGFSGAEIEQAIVSALYDAFSSHAPLDGALILREIRLTKPLSVTRREEIEELRRWASGRTVPAGGAQAPSTPSAAFPRS